MTILPEYAGFDSVSRYPVMPVVKTNSPAVTQSVPGESPSGSPCDPAAPGRSLAHSASSLFEELLLQVVPPLPEELLLQVVSPLPEELLLQLVPPLPEELLLQVVPSCSEDPV